jgi:hypothetical protein
MCSAVRYSRIRTACILPARPEIPDVDIVEMEKIELKELQKPSTPGQVAKVAEDTGYNSCLGCRWKTSSEKGTFD